MDCSRSLRIALWNSKRSRHLSAPGTQGCSKEATPRSAWRTWMDCSRSLRQLCLQLCCESENCAKRLMCCRILKNIEAASKRAHLHHVGGASEEEARTLVSFTLPRS